jgi:hypothetical protein
MDPLSVTASTAAVLDLAEKIVKYLIDVKGAVKGRQEYYDRIRVIDPFLSRLKQRLLDAEAASNARAQSGGGEKTTEPWYRSLAKLKPYIDGLENRMKDLSDLVAPRTGLEMWNDRLKYHWKKEKCAESTIVDSLLPLTRLILTLDSGRFDSLLQQIMEYCDLIDKTLQHDQFAVSLSNKASIQAAHDEVKEIKIVTTEILSTGEETHSIVKNIEVQNSTAFTELNKRLQLFEVRDQKAQQKENEQELQNMLTWLCPLSFNAKQQRLVEEAFRPSVQWFLDSEEFVHWCKGRPWPLRCYGNAGSGKVPINDFAVREIAHLFPDHAFFYCC